MSGGHLVLFKLNVLLPVGVKIVLVLVLRPEVSGLDNNKTLYLCVKGTQKVTGTVSDVPFCDEPSLSVQDKTRSTKSEYPFLEGPRFSSRFLDLF